MAKKEGFNIKMKVNGESYRAKRIEAEDTCADLEVGDSEDGVFEARLGGRRSAKITVENATIDPDDNIHGAPFNIKARSRVELDLFFAGDDETPDIYPVVVIGSVRKAGDVAGLVPVSFSGTSSGEYTLAGEE